MDYLKNFTNDAHSEGRATSEEQPTKENKAESSADDRTKEQSGGWNLGDKLNSALGGGKESEAKEDYLDKGVDLVQQYVLGQGDQSNESAFEQAKDEQISDAIRMSYKSATGSELPLEDK